MYKRVSSNSGDPTPSYGSLHLSNLGSLDNSLRMSYRFRDQFAPILASNESKKSHKAHNRNYSDLVPPTLKKSEPLQFRDCEKWEESKIATIEHRLERIQQKLTTTESKLSQLSRQEHKYHFLEQKLLDSTNKETESKLNEMNLLLSDLKTRIEKVERINSSENSLKFIGLKADLEHHSPGEISNERMDKFVEKITHINHQLVDSLKKEFKQKLSELGEKVRVLGSNKEYEQAANPENQFFKTNRKYSSNPISFIYEEYIRKSTSGPVSPSEKENHCLNQITYYIDPEGFLLDDAGNYLVTSKMKQIKLSERELKMLRKLKILGS